MKGALLKPAISQSILAGQGNDTRSLNDSP